LVDEGTNFGPSFGFFCYPKPEVSPDDFSDEKGHSLGGLCGVIIPLTIVFVNYHCALKSFVVRVGGLQEGRSVVGFVYEILRASSRLFWYFHFVYVWSKCRRVRLSSSSRATKTAQSAFRGFVRSGFRLLSPFLRDRQLYLNVRFYWGQSKDSVL
jgi:hypothetical protein